MWKLLFEWSKSHWTSLWKRMLSWQFSRSIFRVIFFLVFHFAISSRTWFFLVSHFAISSRTWMKTILFWWFISWKHITEMPFKNLPVFILDKPKFPRAKRLRMRHWGICFSRCNLYASPDYTASQLFQCGSAWLLQNNGNVFNFVNSVPGTGFEGTD